MTKRIWTQRLPLVGIVAALALGGSGAALAASGNPQKVAPSAASPANSTQNIVSATFTNPAGSQTFGSVSCPANTRVSGGGVFGAGGTQQHVNSSFPASLGTGWDAWMNNTSTAASSFTVYAICALAS
jgi:hypothetical protein